MLRPVASRLLRLPLRPRTVLAICLGCACVLILIFASCSDDWYDVVAWVGQPIQTLLPRPSLSSQIEAEEENDTRWHAEDPGQRENRLRAEFQELYTEAATLPGAEYLYGHTLRSLVQTKRRKNGMEQNLRKASELNMSYTEAVPVYFNPYPDYNSRAWNKSGHAVFVLCNGSDGRPVQDVLAFRGRPSKFPAPGFGSFELLDIDDSLCFERETRLGPYGYSNHSHWPARDWDQVKWGRLQVQCLDQNKDRFLSRAEAEAEVAFLSQQVTSALTSSKTASTTADTTTDAMSDTRSDNKTAVLKEGRTAILLRAYTGKSYTENDAQIIRSLVTELCLRSGGQYEVFILLQVRELPDKVAELDDLMKEPAALAKLLATHVPAEFHDMVVPWHDNQMRKLYPQLKDETARSVHEGQWLSVQKFSCEHPEFEWIWNWELDVRYTGHHYDLLEKAVAFARRQPRRGLWDRNDRFYIPSYHGDYKADFVPSVEATTSALRAARVGAFAQGEPAIWGPVELPSIAKIAAPKPPVADPVDDDFEWGVDEDADYITLAPMFDAKQSDWIMWNHVWGYGTDEERSRLPRRTTIVTTSRVSRRLLAAMHTEDLAGNHVASEMTPQTVALLHGFKAVYAPHPVLFDRPWSGQDLQKWFNPGPGGSAGGRGSAMGWGRERRFASCTWYYRAAPPSRLYNNWMGYTDTRIGGPAWEAVHGRTCLPALLLHPVKDVRPTEDGYATEYELFYG